MQAFRDELESPMVKKALIERLVRIGATDVEDLPLLNRIVSKTPRLAMKRRGGAELRQLQSGVENWIARKEEPVIKGFHGLIDRLPAVPIPGVKQPVPVGAPATLRLMSAAEEMGVPVARGAVPHIPTHVPYREGLKKGVEVVVKNPEVGPAIAAAYTAYPQLAYMPGTSETTTGYLLGKKKLEQLIDKHIPFPD